MSVRIGVIAVGGKGARLGAGDVQKCLVQIEGKPILEYTIDAFLETDVKTIFLLTGFLHDQIDAYLGSRTGYIHSTIATVFGGTEGEISAILKLQHLLGEDFLYAGGDCIITADSARALIQVAEEDKDSIAIMAASPFPELVPVHPRVVLRAKSRLVQKIYRPGAANAQKLTALGMYYFRPSVFEFLSSAARASGHVSDFIRYAIAESKDISVSTTKDPWFCLHASGDLMRWQNSRMKKFLTSNRGGQ
jgi:glucose-1-phosphate thymidylyltransferase/bifunctional UDP-N-acetylglucosamine pyrophosphorylase/glucosamine-1-phosphate N-acetyltransferase